MKELRLPVLQDVPPIPPAKGDAYLELVEEALALVGARAQLRRDDEDLPVPVRFSLTHPADTRPAPPRK